MSKGNLKEMVKFPVYGYDKLNGFLGMISVHKHSNELYIASKSTDKGDYVGYLKNIFYREVSASNQLWLKNYTKENNVTLTFEVIDVDNDPHIIKYEKSKLVLLSIVKNTVVFEELPYNEVYEVAKKLGIECTKPMFVLNTWEELVKFYKDEKKENIFDLEAEHIEGYILKDSNNFMFKLKKPYYNYWKMIRGLVSRLLLVEDIESTDFNDILNVLDTSEEKEIATLGYKLFKDTGKREVDVLKILELERVKELCLELKFTYSKKYPKN